ncbi:MAG: ATP-dependent DNA helicase RecG [Saccharofermentanales bacterium]
MSRYGINLDDLPGVSKRRKELLLKLGIETVEDLISFFPRDYEDWTSPSAIIDLVDGETGTFTAYVAHKPNLRRKGRMSILKTVLRDDSGASISATWFNQPYYETKLQKDQAYLFRGKIKRNGIQFEVVNPVFEQFTEELQGRIKPVYRLTKGMTKGFLRQVIPEAFSMIRAQIDEPLSDDIRRQHKLAAVDYAYEKIHNPKNLDEFEIARRRLVFEELFMIQAGLRLVKSTLINKAQAMPIGMKEKTTAKKMTDFYKNLPFTLTDSQKQVVSEILADIAKKTPMNRLVQGDVGSGKTVISAAAIALCVFNGFQATLMAPTAVLASQHFSTMKSFFDGFDVSIELLTGSVGAKKKKEIQERLADGGIDLLIGTHALLEGPVQFKNLALAVTDEQHRFGVKQRSYLTQGDKTVPHVLVMSATPIPRTLGLILYGDLDISLVKGLPSGRVPIETYTAKTSDDQRIYQLLDRQIQEGRQVYIVCPMIESTEELDLISVKELYEKIAGQVFPQWKTGLLHGAMATKAKIAAMEDFIANRTQILVSTTVIEVGVDNPNASIMLIQNAERFGLAQLHQLRGRIGRGPYRSICILKSDSDQDAAKERLKIICKNTDGFEIAEKDLMLRGTGDFFGTRQHGIPEMKIANLYQDADVLKETQGALDILFKKDPLLALPENRTLIPSIKNRFGELFANVGI